MYFHEIQLTNYYMKRAIKTLLVIIPFSGLMIISGCKKTTMATLTTAPASELTLVSARTGGNITDDGNADITARGVCWSATENPKVSDKKTSDGTGSGSFSSQLTGLTEGTVYYVRAYATNIEGTSYGNQISFTSVQ